jgi:peptidoglycan/xylan/chitin deacetylase (PgdA/CDA1 family)
MASPTLRAAMKRSADLVDRVHPPPPGIVVLIYHRVGRRSSLEVDLPTALFEEQMALLAESGRVIDLDAALARLAAPAGSSTDVADEDDGEDDDEDDDERDDEHGRSRADPVVITFADGTADLADLAAPILSRHELPALLYLATDFVETRRPFPDDGRPLSWAGVAELAARGWQIGSHTDSHALLDRLPPAAVADELDRSIERIGERIGEAPAHFAYPKAVAAGAAAEREVRARFRSAALAGTRANRYGDTDPWRLARSPVQVSDGMAWFRRKLAGGMAAEDGLRTLLNRRRYAGQTT